MRRGVPLSGSGSGPRFGLGLKLGRSAAQNTNTFSCSFPIRRPSTATAGLVHSGFYCPSSSYCYSYYHPRYSGFHTKATQNQAQAQVEPEPETKVVGTHGRAAKTTATGVEGMETGRGDGDGKEKRKKGRRTYSVADILERRARAGRLVAGTAAYSVCPTPLFLPSLSCVLFFSSLVSIYPPLSLVFLSLSSFLIGSVSLVVFGCVDFLFYFCG